MSHGETSKTRTVDRQIAFRALMRATFLMPAPGRESDLMSGYVTRYLRALITTASLIETPSDKELIKFLEEAQFEIDERDQTITDIFREDDFYYPGGDISHALQSSFLYWSFTFEDEASHDATPILEQVAAGFIAAKVNENPKGITDYLANFTELEQIKFKEQDQMDFWDSPLISIIASDIERRSATHLVIEGKLDNILKQERTTFWKEWFLGFLNGTPLSHELQHRVARIADEDWKQGSKIVARRIEEIRARFELEQQIAQLKAENARLAEKSRFEIGANGGPELDEAKQVVQEIIWEPVETLEVEVNKGTPDKDVIQRQIERLKSGLKWLGSAAGGAAVGNIVSSVWENPSVLVEMVIPILETAQRWLQALINLVG